MRRPSASSWSLASVYALPKCQASGHEISLRVLSSRITPKNQTVAVLIHVIQECSKRFLSTLSSVRFLETNMRDNETIDHHDHWLNLPSKQAAGKLKGSGHTREREVIVAGPAPENVPIA